jgi:hypothetical protein
MTIAYQHHPARLAAIAACENLFVGPPCIRCDAVSPRYVSSGDCRTCYLERRANDPTVIKLRKKRAAKIAKQEAAKAAKIAERDAARIAKAAKFTAEKPPDDDVKLIKINAEYLRRLTLEKLAAIRENVVA